MIKKIEVVNLPYSSETLRWKRGDTIALPHQNLLFIGDNQTGKSTMLKYIYKSLVNSCMFTDGSSHLSDVTNPYLTFTQAFEWESWKIEPYEHEQSAEYHSDANKENQETEFVDALEEAIQAIFGSGLDYIWDARYSTNKQQFEQVLASYKDKVIEENPNWKAPNNVFGIWSESFHEAIELYAQKHTIAPEVIYGTFVLIFEGVYPRLDNDVSRFGYIKLTGTELTKTPIITTFDPKQKKSESMGERSKRLVSSIEPNCIAILDEPTEGISLSAKWEYTEKLRIASETSQILASTHDLWMRALAETHPKWSIYDLDEKKLIKKAK